MNAGAYGHEIGTVTETVRVAREGKVVEVPGNSVQWNYRHTSFREGELLLGATLRLTPDDPEKIRSAHGRCQIATDGDATTRLAFGRLFF